MVPVGGVPRGDDGGGAGSRVAVSVVVPGAMGLFWAATVLNSGLAGSTVVVTLALLRKGRVVGPSAVELAVTWVCTPGMPGWLSMVGTRKVRYVKLTAHVSPVASSNVPSPPGGTKR